MAEVTYYVALPFIGTDDGIAAGEANRMLQSQRGRDASGSVVTQGMSRWRGCVQSYR
jgi:hypothetical protein